jgi:hypothetical protein
MINHISLVNNSKSKSMAIKKLFFTIASIPSIMLGTLAALCQPTLAKQVSVVCDYSGVTPKIVATAERENVTVLQFVSEYFSPQKALQNCQSTAQKLQTLNLTDNSKYLTSGLVDRLPVVCAVAQRGSSCNSNSAEILFSLETQTEPIQAFYQMLGKDLKSSQLDNPRTVGRIYADIRPDWWRFLGLIK